MAIVDEDRTDRARPAVQVLVRAPGGEVDVPVVERELDVAGGVGQVPADEGAGRVTGIGQPLDLLELARREVDAGQEDEGEVLGVLGDRALEVARPDRRLAAPRSDHDQVRGRVEPALGEVAGQGMAIGREERRVRQDAAAPAGRAEERREQQVDVDGQAVEDRDLGSARTHDPGHRLAKRCRRT